MLPSPERLLLGLTFFARRRDPWTRVEVSAITATLEEAERLAAGQESDEPAALFYACARRSRAFGALARDFVPFIARHQAREVGYELGVEDVVLDLLRTRILLGAITFDDLRAELAALRRPQP
jgi:hypothetical protein